LFLKISGHLLEIWWLQIEFMVNRYLRPLNRQLMSWNFQIQYSYLHSNVRDWPFNLQGVAMVVFFIQNFFFGQHELEHLFFLSCKTQFFPELNTRLYDKNSESDFFFFLHQNQNIFLEKNNSPPLEVKLSIPNYLHRCALPHYWQDQISGNQLKF
jgi:hypothetical protein